MRIIKNEREILEHYFNIFENESGYELETWTNGGVDMIITIKKNGDTLLEQLKEVLWMNNAIWSLTKSFNRCLLQVRFSLMQEILNKELMG